MPDNPHGVDALPASHGQVPSLWSERNAALRRVAELGSENERLRKLLQRARPLLATADWWDEETDDAEIDRDELLPEIDAVLGEDGK